MNRLRQTGGAAISEILINFVLPYVIYVKAAPRYGDVHALLASSLPPILWSLIEFARKRRVDAVSLLALGGIVLSLLAFVGGGSARFLQLRENLVTGLIALVFLGSAAIRRPLIYVLARATMKRKSAEAAAAFEDKRENPYFKRTMMMMTIVWGLGLLLQTIIVCVLVFELPIATYLIVSPFVSYGAMGLLAAWTYLCAKRARREGERLREETSFSEEKEAKRL